MAELATAVGPPAASRSGRRAIGTGWMLTLGLIILAEAILLGGTLTNVGSRLLYDFQGGLYNAGVAILHGHTPYQAGFLAHQSAIMRAGRVAIGESADHPFSIPVYPALANVLIVPLALLPFWLAGAIFTAGSVAAMVAGLRLLGVRDRRCLAVAVLSWPFLFGLFLGAIGPFLVLGAGIAWRWRDRIGPPALAVASLVAVKVFPWTLGVWLLITRRYRALALCVAAGLVLTFGAWALIGFDGLAQYPKMLSEVSQLQENRAVSVAGVLVIAGVSSSAATVITLLLAVAILCLAVRLARGVGGDRRAFGLAILAALTGTPIVWEHYMVLLFIPVALASPRLSRAWLIPVLPGIVTEIFNVIVPAPANLPPFSPDSLRTTIPWLVAQIAAGVVLCTTPEQRRVWRRRPAARRAGLQTATDAS